MKTQRERLAYAAGLFESRGSMRTNIRQVNGVSYRTTRLRLRSPSETHVTFFRDLFKIGGTGILRRGRKRGSTEWWEYRAQGADAVEVLKQLAPYLQVRTPELEGYLKGKTALTGRLEE